jgi:hypothetical protein
MKLFHGHGVGGDRCDGDGDGASCDLEDLALVTFKAIFPTYLHTVVFIAAALQRKIVSLKIRIDNY